MYYFNKNLAHCKRGLGDSKRRCFQPPMSLVKEIIESRGAQLRRVLSDDAGVISHAFEVRGSLVQEMSTTNPAHVLPHACKVNPEALNKINFELFSRKKNLSFCGGSFIVEPKNRDGGPFSSRICEMRIEFSDVIKSRTLNKIIPIVEFISLAMPCLASLKKVRVKYLKTSSAIWFLEMDEVFRLFKDKLKELDRFLLCTLRSEINTEALNKINFELFSRKKNGFWIADITRRQSNDQLMEEEDSFDVPFENLLAFLEKL